MFLKCFQRNPINSQKVYSQSGAPSYSQSVATPTLKVTCPKMDFTECGCFHSVPNDYVPLKCQCNSIMVIQLKYSVTPTSCQQSAHFAQKISCLKNASFILVLPASKLPAGSRGQCLRFQLHPACSVPHLQRMYQYVL